MDVRAVRAAATACWCVLALGLFPGMTSTHWNQLGSDLDGEAAFDSSGWSVSSSGDGSRVAIGATGNDGGAEDGGHVRVFDYVGSQWVQAGFDISGTETNEFSGFSVSISADGLRIAVGAPGNSAGGTQAGAVRVYEWLNPQWVQLGPALIGEAANDRFGSSVSLSANGSRLAVGAPGNDGGGSESGHVRVFRWIDPNWFQVGADLDGEAPQNSSGYSVSLSGDGLRVAIGAPDNNDGGTDAGHVRVYTWFNLTSTWLFVGSDIDGEAPGDASGTSVSLSADGSRVAIGAVNNDGAGTDAGQVRVFDYVGPDWVQLGVDIDGETALDAFGKSVSLSADGSRLAVGAPFNDGTGPSAGHVRVYEWLAPSWVQVGADIDGEADADHSGYATSLSGDGDRVAVGAPTNSGNGNLSGHTRVYSGPLFEDDFESGNTSRWSSVVGGSR